MAARSLGSVIPRHPSPLQGSQSASPLRRSCERGEETDGAGASGKSGLCPALPDPHLPAWPGLAFWAGVIQGGGGGKGPLKRPLPGLMPAWASGGLAQSWRKSPP